MSIAKDEIYQRLVKVFGKILKLKDRPITRESRLREDLELDSVELLDFAVLVEGEFDIDIGDYESTWVNSVGDILKLIEEKLSEKQV